MKNTVVVLLSTYNGERYLREQLDSVLNQDAVVVYLLVRDDGSSDSTVDILKEYSSRDSRVKYYVGTNVGPKKSFFDLLTNAGVFTYYAFCDQDDYWEPDKLQSAIAKLRGQNNNKPAMYFSNLKVVDKQLHFCRMSRSMPYKTDNKYAALVDFPAVGCTEVFNFAAASFLASHWSDKCLMHDSWLFLICSFFGVVIYDNKPHIQYRQHENNVIGTKKNKKEKMKESLKRIGKISLQPRYQSASAFLETFSNDLSTKDRAKVEKIINYKSNLFSRLNLLFDREIRSVNYVSDLKYRILIILGLV